MSRSWIELGRVLLNWSSSDDYGLSQVALVFQLGGGKEERVVLQTPAQAILSAFANMGMPDLELPALPLEDIGRDVLQAIMPSVKALSRAIDESASAVMRLQKDIKTEPMAHGLDRDEAPYLQ